MSPTFASLSIYNYRVYAAGAIVSNIGTWMGRVAQDWLVLTELTNHDSTALGIVTGLQFAPVVLLAPLAGTFADRFDKRKLLAISQSALALTAAVLAVLVLTDTVAQSTVDLAVHALAAHPAVAEAAVIETIRYVKERDAFGKKLLDFQNTQFVLAECKTEALAARVMAPGYRQVIRTLLA